MTTQRAARLATDAPARRDIEEEASLWLSLGDVAAAIVAPGEDGDGRRLRPAAEEGRFDEKAAAPPPRQVAGIRSERSGSSDAAREVGAAYQARRGEDCGPAGPMGTKE